MKKRKYGIKRLTAYHKIYFDINEITFKYKYFNYTLKPKCHINISEFAIKEKNC